jgi:anti-sigma factor ChrR (cupin superfamily)
MKNQTLSGYSGATTGTECSILTTASDIVHQANGRSCGSKRPCGGKEPMPPPARRWSEPEWKQVAPGIECKLLSTDAERLRVSMLVRLAPGASYPAHTHAGVEELHLLDGELWIDARKLFPGEHNYGAPGAGDERVWSETGCTCLLVTSTKDVPR